MTTRPTLNTANRDVLLFHTAFFLVAIPAALLAPTAALGWLVLALAITYNGGLLAVGRARQQPRWVALWCFLAPVSITLPFADWMLAERMGTLIFPDHGVPRLGGEVPLYFMGMWIMLLWPLCWLAEQQRRPYVFISIAALLAFLIWEWAARPMELWHAQNVLQIAGFALYPLPAEMALAALCLWSWRQLQNAPRVQQVIGGVSISIFYSGALAISLLLIV